MNAKFIKTSFIFGLLHKVIYMNGSLEWWIEIEINPINNNINLFDEIIQRIYSNFLIDRDPSVITWHFFRERSNLRFRIQLINRQSRKNIAETIKKFLDSIDIIQEHFFANHGNRIQNFDNSYSGELESYGRMWPQQKKIWEWGSKMAIEAYKEFKETGGNSHTRAYQLKRVFHLLSNQLKCEFNEPYIQFLERHWE